VKRFVKDFALLAGLVLCCSPLRAQTPAGVGRIVVGSGKTYVLDSAIDIERVSLAAPETAEVVVVSARSVLINGKAPGETSAILWLSDGTRKEYDVSVVFATSRLDVAKRQIEQEFGDAVQIAGDATAVYLTGTVKTLYDAQRAVSIGAAVGRTVNLLKVDLPPQQQQILLKVKFADVDRSKSLSLGANILGTPGGYPFNVTTGANSPSRFTSVSPATSTLADALNILMFDPHANLLATIQALQAQNVLEILAEPNLLAMNGHVATFVSGGEFPYPTLQGGGAGVGQVTIQFQEFGIKLRFTPTITPRGTIRLHVVPEVSSLDFADSLTVEGGTVPALTTRRVETEVELEDGQSFAIAGLLDRQTTDTLSKIPGLGDIPILGKFFTSKSITKNNSELVVIVTPELVAPIPKDQPIPELEMPEKFLEGPGVMTTAPRTPGTDKTGPPPPRPVRNEVSVQEMEKLQLDEQREAQQSGGTGGGYGSGAGTGTPATGTPTVTLPLTVPNATVTSGTPQTNLGQVP
jgi:pilus assembly protein CpaC